jgi:hypothetical protein
LGVKWLNSVNSVNNVEFLLSFPISDWGW